MTGRDRREGDENRDRSISTETPDGGETNMDGMNIEDLQEEELERAATRWEADDRRVPSNTTDGADLPADEDDLDNDVIDSAAEALTDMNAREMRRSGFRAAGDDYNPGIDTDVNAPKQEQLRD